MDPVSLATLLVTFAETFSKLMAKLLRKSGASPKSCSCGRSSPCCSSRVLGLQNELSWLSDCLQHLKSVSTCDLSSNAVETLVNTLLQAVEHVRKGLPPEDLEQYQKRFKSEYLQLVKEALLQMQPNSMKARTAQVLNKEQMVSAITAIVQKEAVDNPMLNRVLPFVHDIACSTETFQMLYDKLRVFQCHDNSLPMLQASEPEEEGTCELLTPEEVGIVMEKENKSEQISPGKEVQLVSGAELFNEVVLYNPNRDLGLVPEKGEGEVHVSKCKGNKWKVKYKGSSSVALRVVRGKMEMQVSPELGFLYYEVKLEEMIEQGYSSNPELYPHLKPGDLKPGYAGVGVGLACHFETKKLAGKYHESYGYDGRVGQVFLEKRRDCKLDLIGRFKVGDTFGIGLCTQHEGKQPFLFLTKNGVFQGRMSHHTVSPSRLATYSDSLYPIITLASLEAEILVNFHGPFLFTSFSDLDALAENAWS